MSLDNFSRDNYAMGSKSDYEFNVSTAQTSSDGFYDIGSGSICGSLQSSPEDGNNLNSRNTILANNGFVSADREGSDYSSHQKWSDKAHQYEKMFEKYSIPDHNYSEQSRPDNISSSERISTEYNHSNVNTDEDASDTVEDKLFITPKNCMDSLEKLCCKDVFVTPPLTLLDWMRKMELEKAELVIGTKIAHTIKGYKYSCFVYSSMDSQKICWNYRDELMKCALKVFYSPLGDEM